MSVAASPDSRNVSRKAVRRLDAATAAPFVIFLIVYALVPRFAADKELTMLIYIGINTMLAISLNLLMGYAGQVSLGHAAFFGLGAYTSAILTVRPIPAEVIPGLGTGLGVAAGCAVFTSLTRASGARLASAAAAMVALAWGSQAVHLHPAAVLLISAAGMAAFAAAARSGALMGGASGLTAAVVTLLCQHLLAGVLQRGGASPWSGMVAGVGFSGLVAYLLGGQVLRLKGHYLAMATLGFGVIVEIVFRQWTAVTGGSSDGIFGIPVMRAEWLGGIGRMTGVEVSPRVEYYYLVWAFVFVCLMLGVNIVRSRVGRAFRAVHGSEVAAESLGVDTSRYKVQVFVLSAGIASVAGSLYAHQAGVGYIHPSEFGFGVSAPLVVMVVVGGMASIWGALLGATTLQLIKTWLLGLEKTQHTLFGLTLTGLEPIVFGAVLIGVMIVMPQGLVRGVSDAAAAALRGTRRGRPGGSG